MKKFVVLQGVSCPKVKKASKDQIIFLQDVSMVINGVRRLFRANLPVLRAVFEESFLEGMEEKGIVRPFEFLEPHKSFNFKQGEIVTAEELGDNLDRFLSSGIVEPVGGKPSPAPSKSVTGDEKVLKQKKTGKKEKKKK